MRERRCISIAWAYFHMNMADMFSPNIDKGVVFPGLWGG